MKEMLGASEVDCTTCEGCGIMQYRSNLRYYTLNKRYCQKCIVIEQSMAGDYDVTLT
jgi:hypothetical protein